ncbi:MAG: hypothetical protein P1U53_00825 [Sulfitobacter sp.]|nr:hypothetical protein [Sulfitobacter sp.]
MRLPDRGTLALGLTMLILALVIGFAWVPMDSSTGLVEKVRRQVSIGDGLAPTLAAVFIGLGGLLVAFFERRPEETPRITSGNLLFTAILLLLLALSLALMRWSGPALAGLLTEEGYRLLRDTAPWKYLGFLTGGTVLVTGLVALVERRLTLRAILIGLATVVVLIVLYDLPFDDLLLPPNGDV